MNNLHAGDIIFQTLKENTPFNDAVSCSGVVLNIQEIITNINHVGLYMGRNIIIEATQKEGVTQQSLSNFLSNGTDHVVGTVHDNFTIKNALTRAKTCLGLPYNYSFYPDQDGFYCSELITYAFKTKQGRDYFNLYPMNFVDCTTQQILPYWITYYHSLNRRIPQGVLGSHPQQLLRQKYLFKTRRLLVIN
ncbi:MAG: hypothetical protein J6562_03030 [Candidatus Schmidhempelia sp.]|nr:hypothetical protein [Candidatus Schmidhempelia sp.]